MKTLLIITFYTLTAIPGAASHSVDGQSVPSCRNWDFKAETNTFHNRGAFVPHDDERNRERAALALQLQKAGDRCFALVSEAKTPRRAAELAARGWEMRISRLYVLGDPDRQRAATLLEAILAIEAIDGSSSPHLLSFLLSRALLQGTYGVDRD